MKTIRQLLLSITIGALSVLTIHAQVQIAPWEIHEGGNIISVPKDLYMSEMDSRSLVHGDPVVYNLLAGPAAIPNPNDAAWMLLANYPNGFRCDGTNENDLCYDPLIGSVLMDAFMNLDFTYFQTFVEVSEDSIITDARIEFQTVDDGARAYVFNSQFPNGVFPPNSDARLRASRVTADLTPYMVSGEPNRIVVVQFDDARIRSYLTTADFVVEAASKAGECANDIESPIIFCPDDVSVTINRFGEVTAIDTVTIFNIIATDNCNDRSELDTDFDTEVIDSTTVDVEITVTDSSGNASNCIVRTTPDITTDDLFITTWTVESEDTEIVFYVNPSLTYDYNIDWGDGTVEVGKTTEARHTYSAAGTYTVLIGGDFPQFYVADTDARESNDVLGETDDNAVKLSSVEQWGTIDWQAMDYAFALASNMVYNASDLPDLDDVNDMQFMFARASSFDGTIGNWKVANVQNMQAMFAFASRFDQPIGSWNVANVTTMESMFEGARSFNQDIGNWNTANVLTMESMFSSARTFNQDIGSWNVSNVTNTISMFSFARSFNQDIGNWNTSSVLNMRSMFSFARNFNQDISNWEVSNVSNMESVFEGARSFNQAIGNWDVSNVTNMKSLFNDTRTFNQSLNGWNVSNVMNMESMFEGAVFNEDITNWDVSSVTTMEAMFSDTRNFNQAIGDWNVSNVTTMESMFEEAEAFNQAIGDWDVSGVTIMESMFEEAEVFNQDIGDWRVSDVINMESMFEDAESFNQNLGNWRLVDLLRANDMLSSSGLDIDNYDATLVGWAAQSEDFNSDVIIGADDLEYCEAGEAARDILSDINWEFVGDELAEDCEDNIQNDEPVVAFRSDVSTAQTIELSVSPNPFFDQAQVRVNLLTEGRIELNLHNAAGKLVKTIARNNAVVGNNDFTIDRNGLNKGIYFLTIFSEHTTETMPIVIAE